MPSLAETQFSIARALIRGNTEYLPDSLAGGPDARARFEIHLRHYETSLRIALEDKFPATQWLLGGTRFRAAAVAYVRQQPPRSACIADYGRDFPDFIAGFYRTTAIPNLGPFSRLEWLLGRASISVDAKPLTWSALSQLDSDHLLDTNLELQPGLGYMHASHAIDSLIELYLSEERPDTFELPAGEVRIEVTGSKGSFRITRLDPGTYEFRNAICQGSSISDAAALALESDDRFDPGIALRRLAESNLIASVRDQER